MMMILSSSSAVAVAGDGRCTMRLVGMLMKVGRIHRQKGVRVAWRVTVWKSWGVRGARVRGVRVMGKAAAVAAVKTLGKGQKMKAALDIQLPLVVGVVVEAAADLLLETSSSRSSGPGTGWGNSSSSQAVCNHSSVSSRSSKQLGHAASSVHH
jgi:hypothetical protein